MLGKPEVTTPAETFAHVARAYCAWCESEPRQEMEEVGSALRLLPALHLAALELPPVLGDEEAPSISHDEWHRIIIRFASFPFNYYAQCFDPLQVPYEELPGLADAADDLADIWRDVKGGLILYDAGLVNSAIWEWRFNFYSHWGRHLTGVLYALHCWLAQNHPRWLDDNVPAAASPAIPELSEDRDSFTSKPLRFDAFGRLYLVQRVGTQWQAYMDGAEGKRVPAGFVVPDFIAADEIEQFLFDLFHENATPGNGDVRRIE